MVRRSLFLTSLAVVALVSALGDRCATAAPPTEAELARAREQFGAGRRLENAGRWGEALSVFQGVAAVKMTPQVRFHLALCLENVGMWTQALDDYARAASEAVGIAPDVVKEANEHLRKLELLVPTVSVHVQGAVPGDDLFIDGRRFPADENPPPVRANPGSHTAEVRRAGAVVARAYFALDPQSTRWVELKVGAIAKTSAPPPPVPRTPPNPSTPIETTLGWSGLGLGAASAVTMGVFIGLRANSLSRLDAACPSYSNCPWSVQSIVHEGQREALLVNVFGVATGLLTATGIVLLAVAPSSSMPASESPTPKVSLEVGPQSLMLRGAF